MRIEELKVNQDWTLGWDRVTVGMATSDKGYDPRLTALSLACSGLSCLSLSMLPSSLECSSSSDTNITHSSRPALEANVVVPLPSSTEFIFSLIGAPQNFVLWG